MSAFVCTLRQHLVSYRNNTSKNFRYETYDTDEFAWVVFRFENVECLTASYNSAEDSCKRYEHLLLLAVVSVAIVHSRLIYQQRSHAYKHTARF